MKRIGPSSALILIGGICSVALAIERAVHEKWIAVLLFSAMGVGTLLEFANRLSAQRKSDESAKL